VTAEGEAEQCMCVWTSRRLECLLTEGTHEADTTDLANQVAA